MDNLQKYLNVDFDMPKSKKELKERISGSLESSLSDIYDELGITTGDISPDQDLVWDEICEKAAELFEVLIRQNSLHYTK